MARTYEANVILGLKDQLTKGAPKAAAAVDALAKSLDRAEKVSRDFAASAGKMPNWGSAFQKQIDRLRLAPAEIERLKASWASLNREIAQGGDKIFQTSAATRWKNEALAGILEIREARRQLTADGIREARVLAAVEKRLAADVAREVAKVAKDAAREKIRAAREAARGEQQAARETARIAREEARQAAAEARRLDREASRARREMERQEARERRRLVGWGSDTVRNLGYAAGLGGGSYLAGRGIRGTALSAAELEREKSRDYLAGLSAQDSAKLQARAFQTSGDVRAVDAATMHNILRETSLTNIGVGGAMQLAPDLANSLAVISSMKSPDEALASLTRLLRGLDTLGKNVDIDVVRSLLDGFVRAQGVEGAEFSVGDVYTAAKRSKSGGFALNERFLTRILPALIADIGPDQVGTALGSSVSQVIGGRATKDSIAVQQRYGLRNKKGKFQDQDLFLEDPFEYTLQKLVPALQKRGIDTNDEVAVTAAMSKLFSNQRVADLFGRMVLQAEQYLAKERKMNQAPGTAAGPEISARDPFVAAAGALDQLKNAVGALVEPLTPSAIGGLNTFADAMRRIAAWARSEGGMTTGDLAIGAGAAAGVGLGAYKIWSALSGGFGLQASAVALNGSAAALSAAAAKLGGGAAAGTAGSAAAGAATGGALAAGITTGGVVVGGLGLAAGSAVVASDPNAARVSENPMLSAMSGDFGFGAAIIAAAEGAAPAAREAGGGIGSDIVAGLKNAEPAAQAAGMSIFERIKAIFSGGIDVPVRPTMAYPGVGLNRPGARGPGGLGIDSAGRATGPGRASGGAVYAGGLYQINEFQQEMFVPAQDGTVVPPDRLGKGGKGHTFHINGSAADAKAIAEEIVFKLAGVYGDYGTDFA